MWVVGEREKQHVFWERCHVFYLFFLVRWFSCRRKIKTIEFHWCHVSHGTAVVGLSLDEKYSSNHSIFLLSHSVLLFPHHYSCLPLWWCCSLNLSVLITKQGTLLHTHCWFSSLPEHAPRSWGLSGKLDSAPFFCLALFLSLFAKSNFLYPSLFLTPPLPLLACFLSPREPGGQIGARLS